MSKRQALAARINSISDPFTDNKIVPSLVPSIEPSGEPVRGPFEVPEEEPLKEPIAELQNRPRTDRNDGTEDNIQQAALNIIAEVLKSPSVEIAVDYKAADKFDKGLVSVKRKTKAAKFYLYEDQELTVDRLISAWGMITGEKLNKSAIVRDMFDNWIEDRRKQIRKRQQGK